MFTNVPFPSPSFPSPIFENHFLQRKRAITTYIIDISYSHQVVNRTAKANDEVRLKVKARFTNLKNYIECETSRFKSISEI